MLHNLIDAGGETGKHVGSFLLMLEDPPDDPCRPGRFQWFPDPWRAVDIRRA
jgi:hypothetical protein